MSNTEFVPASVTRGGVTISWEAPLLFRISGLPDRTEDAVAIFATDTEAASAWLAVVTK